MRGDPFSEIIGAVTNLCRAFEHCGLKPPVSIGLESERQGLSLVAMLESSPGIVRTGRFALDPSGVGINGVNITWPRAARTEMIEGEVVRQTIERAAGL